MDQPKLEPVKFDHWAEFEHQPIAIYELPAEMQAKLRATTQPRLPAFDDRDDDCPF
jgi:hypothetical protein